MCSLTWWYLTERLSFQTSCLAMSDIMFVTLAAD